jgi:CDP-glucose 4,6-dehydratase
MIVQKQYEDIKYQGYYNVGPDEVDCVTTGHLVDIFCSEWGNGQAWENKSVDGPHEANFLKLDCSKLKSVFGWKTTWNVVEAVKKTCEWAKAYESNENLNIIMDKQIKEFLEERQYE